MGRIAAIFPGQGAQSVGMGRDVVAAYPAAREVFDRAGQVLGVDLASVCFNGPPEALEATDIQQPAIFTTSVAIWCAMREVAPSGFRFDAAAGLSLGEYTALHVAGGLTFEDALRVLARRGQLMQEAARARPGGMISLMGLEPDQVRRLCEEAADAGVVRPANFNCPGQIVVSGERPACERVLALAEQRGARAVVLKVAGAFHSPLMQPASDGLREALAGTAVQTPSIPVFANVNAQPHRDPDTIRDWLVQQVVQPVQWQSIIENLIRSGFDRFVEIGPGKTLSGLVRRIDRNVSAVSINSAAAVEQFKETL